MKKSTYLLILALCVFTSSCTMMVKGFAKLLVKDYNDYTSTHISDIQIVNQNGKSETFGNLYPQKTVYLYVWGNKKLSEQQEKSYLLLKERFAKYPDVVFATLYVGSDTTLNTNRLVNNASSAEFREILKLGDPAPFIIGKDGAILAYKGPKPDDKIIVDYVICQAIKGEDGTKSAKRFIRGVNGNSQFKSDKLIEWYTAHYGKAPANKLPMSLSSTN
ncbi:hypothetical protein G7074_23005 [Pedobacter sp. HDW13]|uniref:hypothetical protein n=1 Tax=unclassified Pedobacter TaxID=2628915 RepID=UPI000F5B0049|nr:MULTISPECIES: hypothetical protein [unclassified Pedobacter]QIL41881.1 hypothetical protein G7074_23005 [Pedobacter sp. HDW13]RQO68432.1 hypothetical protein DBR40_19500 [Pedobacter sp. KBW01]